MSLKDNLHKLREASGYNSAKEFSKLVKVPYTTYMGYENRGSWPTEENLCKIANLLGVTIDELLGNQPPNKKKRMLEDYIRDCKKAGITVSKQAYKGEFDKINHVIITLSYDDPLITLSATYNENEFINMMNSVTAELKSQTMGMLNDKVRYQITLQNQGLLKKLYTDKRNS